MFIRVYFSVNEPVWGTVTVPRRSCYLEPELYISVDTATVTGRCHLPSAACSFVTWRHKKPTWLKATLMELYFRKIFAALSHIRLY